MQRTVILGAGAFGREVLAYALATGEWNIIGFLDADPRALDRFGLPLPILGDPLMAELPSDAVLLCAIADPKTKLRLCRRLTERGARFASLVHPSAIVGPRSSLGQGCVIAPNSVLTSDVCLGEFVTINVNTCIGHDAAIGAGCTLGPNCAVTGGVVLGEGVFMGTHASVLPRVRVGDGAVIAAGSVAMWNVRPHSTVLGVPASRIANRGQEKHF